MNTLSVAQVVKTIRDLPSLSIVVTDLISSFETSDANIAELAEKVSQDQALTAKTLRLANSSFYGLSRKVTTIQQAIMVLGFDSVRALISAASIVDNFYGARESTDDFNVFWRHSIGTALCSKHIARAAGLNQNYAFICGLLHDIGKLVLTTRFPDQYREAVKYRNEHDSHAIDAEKAVLGITHAAIGRLLADSWKFPVLMQNAIANHHEPAKADLGGMPCIVHVANALVHGLDLVDEPKGLVPEVSEAAWKSLSISEPDLRRVLRDTELEFEEACQILAA
jgi:putative nucleotidyltransferase with HDIG domain